jgi:hypothetical protein
MPKRRTKRTLPTSFPDLVTKPDFFIELVLKPRPASGLRPEESAVLRAYMVEILKEVEDEERKIELEENLEPSKQVARASSRPPYWVAMPVFWKAHIF